MSELGGGAANPWRSLRRAVCKFVAVWWHYARNSFEHSPALSDVDALPLVPAPRSTGRKHMITVAPESMSMKLVRELDRRGWIVSIGHTRATSTA